MLRHRRKEVPCSSLHPDVQVWARGSGLEGGSVALGDKDWRRTSIPAATDWAPVTVRGVKSTSGQLEVRFELTGTAGQELYIDDMAISRGKKVDDVLA